MFQLLTILFSGPGDQSSASTFVLFLVSVKMNDYVENRLCIKFSGSVSEMLDLHCLESMGLVARC
jgi:hypothetical protein